MGREADAQVHWQGETGHCHVLLESDALILRGELRVRLLRAQLSNATADGDALRIATPEGPLDVDLGAKDAAKWAAVLNRPLPTLAEKLGVGAARPAFVVGELTDATLRAALSGARTDDPASAAFLVTELLDQGQLDLALDVVRRHPRLPLWCIYRKGAGADPGDAAVRSHMRGAGLIDTKSTAVSATMTATRYGFPKPSAR